MLILQLWMLVSGIQGRIFSGTYSLNNKWKFLARFCYEEGRHTRFIEANQMLNFSIEMYEDACDCNPTLLFYYDTPEQWYSVYDQEISCDAKVRQSVHRIRIPSSDALCSNIKDPNKRAYIKCEGRRSFSQTQDRWWYIAVSNCDSEQTVSFNYSLTFTNGNYFLTRHYSADEMGITECTLVSIVIAFCITCITFIYSVMLASRRLNHETFKVFKLSCGCYFIHLVFLTVYYCYYGTTGIPPRAYLVTARIFEAFATSTFLSVLLGFSTGYTIVRPTMSLTAFSVLLTFTGAFTLLQICAIVWEENVFDPGSVLYLYQSPPGYLLAVVYIPAWVYFVSNCSIISYRFRRKAVFYLAFAGFYSVWLLSLPIMILIANTLLPDISRRKTVMITQQVIWLLSYVYMLIIFLPSQHNLMFPFHLRTTKVDFGNPSSPAQDNNYAVTDDKGNTYDFATSFEESPDKDEVETRINYKLFTVPGKDTTGS